MHAVDEMMKLKEEREKVLNDKMDENIFIDVLDKDIDGYLRAYVPGERITQHFEEVVEVKKNVEKAVQEASNDVENARKEAEGAQKKVEDARKEVEVIRCGRARS
ncbi:ATP synthase subunit a, partial [Bienertia sinuspersici]